MNGELIYVFIDSPLVGRLFCARHSVRCWDYKEKEDRCPVLREFTGRRGRWTLGLAVLLVMTGTHRSGGEESLPQTEEGEKAQNSVLEVSILKDKWS